MNEIDQLASLADESSELNINGERLVIRPLKVGQLPGIAKALRGVEFSAAQDGEGIDLISLIASHGDQVIDAVGIAIVKPRAWVEELELDDLIEIAGIVFEKNADFFFCRAMPAIESMLQRATAAVGSIASESSEKTVNPGSA